MKVKGILDKNSFGNKETFSLIIMDNKGNIIKKRGGEITRKRSFKKVYI